jgi:regulator of protease activity HflC (stomatin/prohibitin superfamily)
VAWIVFLALAIPLIGVIAWVALDESFVRIQPGQLGLLLVHGRATDTVLEPGPHWVPALRRRLVQTYPALELSFTAGTDGRSEDDTDPLARFTSPLLVNLGDRNPVTIAYTIRFRLDRERLILIHDRFGPEGIWTAVRDGSARVLRSQLGRPDLVIDDLVGPERAQVEQQLADAVTGALGDDGLLVTSFFLGDLDLGRAGEVIEAIARARLELEREQAEAAMRLARAQIDADLAPFIAAAATDAALRYREVDSWRELARSQATGVVLRPARRPTGGAGSGGDSAASEAPASVEPAPPADDA